jgi:hypothetical protein
MAHQALFAGLVYDEHGALVTTGYVGSDAHYLVEDDGFVWHVDAEIVDRQVLGFFLEQLEQNQELAVEQALRMMGKDDLFTKAALDHSVRNIDMEQIIAAGIPSQARDMLGIMGFRITINHRGDVLDMNQPMVSDDEG